LYCCSCNPLICFKQNTPGKEEADGRDIPNEKRSIPVFSRLFKRITMLLKVGESMGKDVPGMSYFRKEKQMGNSRGLNWIIAILGVWEILAPFILGYSNITAALWNAIIIGLIFLVLGVWAAVASGSTTERTLDWINLIAGAWLIIAPFILGFSGAANRAAMWNPIIVGAIVVILELWALLSARSAGPVGPGRGM
jgi:hypothetical protein